MNDQPYIPPQGPLQLSAPQIFEAIGGVRLQRFSRRHYQNLSESAIRGMFPADAEGLKAAAGRQADFLTGVLGGPPLYRDKHGPPRMRARHFPFAIDEAARQEWLRCFREAFVAEEGLGLSPTDQQELLTWIAVFSAWMVNVAPTDGAG